jgi:hypothetical protein
MCPAQSTGNPIDLISAILLPGLAAGLIAIGATVLIERYGGVVGGLLSTLPTTIVPATLGILAANPDPQAFQAAMAAVPVGMAVGGLFLMCWRVLPSRVGGTGRQPLFRTTALALLLWVVAAGVGISAIAGLRDVGVPPLAVGVAAFAALEVGGILACRTHVPSPTGTQPVSPWALLARGVLAMLAVGAAGALAGFGSASFAGMASVFPAIFLTTMVSLWWSQGEAVPLGAVGPMILGSGAVGAFALVAAWSMPAFGPIAGTVVAWIVASGGVTAPAWWWLNR